MQQLILIIVGAAWLVVLVPPMLRARANRPTSSVDHFRRNLAVLQQTAPPSMNPLASMSRPLAGGRQTISTAYARASLRRTPTDPRLRRSDVPLARRADIVTATPVRTRYADGRYPDGRQHGSEDATAPLQRRSETREISRHQLMRRRREQTVRTLLVLAIASATLAFIAQSPALIYVCALFVLSLFAYCAKLLRLRREAEMQAARGYSR